VAGRMVGAPRIAEVKTPLLKVTTRTDATARKYTVRRAGAGYPTEGGPGLRFPYRTPRKPIVTTSPQFKRVIANPIGTKAPTPEWYATDNGFASVFDMDRAHRPIVDLALRVLGAEGGNVLDLGCGNGALLKKIHLACPQAIPFGIDCDADRIGHARELLPDYGDKFVCGDLLTDDRVWVDDRQYVLALLMPGRLLESKQGNLSVVRTALRRRCETVLVYAYGDWLARYGGLDGLAQKAGLVLLSEGDDVRASLARVQRKSGITS
jgi:SAM-dependent methyltransferase